MDRDYYRCLEDRQLLIRACESGIDPEMAIALAERVEALLNKPSVYHSTPSIQSGGKYWFNQRSVQQ